MKFLLTLSLLIVVGCSGELQIEHTSTAGINAENSMIATGGNSVEVTINTPVTPTVMPVTFDIPNEVATISVPAGCGILWDTTGITDNLAFWAQYSVSVVANQDYFPCDGTAYTCGYNSSTEEVGFGLRINAVCVEVI